MWIADKWKDYEVLDCSSGEKLERWGKYRLLRPDPQVIWSTPKNPSLWGKLNAHYHRSSKGGGEWEFFDLPEQWTIEYRELKFNLKPFSFKHTGLFPEQAVNWDWMRSKPTGYYRRSPKWISSCYKDYWQDSMNHHSCSKPISTFIQCCLFIHSSICLVCSIIFLHTPAFRLADIRDL